MRLIDADEFFKTYPELAIEPYINAPTVEEVSIMNNDEAYKHIENIVFKYEEKELSSLEDRKLNNKALNHIREALKNERPQG